MWPRAVVEFMLLQYKQHENLYNVRRPDYKDRVKHTKSLFDIYERVKKVDPTVTVEGIKAKIHELRSKYLKETNVINASKRSGAGREDVYVPKLWCYSLLEFLRPYVNTRALESNRSAINKENYGININIDEDINIYDKIFMDDSIAGTSRSCFNRPSPHASQPRSSSKKRNFGLSEKLEDVKLLGAKRLDDKSEYDWLSKQLDFEFRTMSNSDIKRETAWEIQRVLKEAVMKDAALSKETPQVPVGDSPYFNNNSTVISSDPSSLLILNNDCLHVIFKHMEIKDQINLARCSCRLRDVFVMRVMVVYRNLDLEDLESLSSWQIRNFFEMAGPYIETLIARSFFHHFNTVIDFIGIYCINVKSISMSRVYLSADGLRKLLRNTYLVEVLNLDEVELQDESILVLKKLKNLKKLSLDKNYKLTGREIKCLTTVNDLSLNGCKAIVPTFFKRICENLNNLKYLNIQACPSLKKYSTVLSIAVNLHELETIKMSCFNDDIDLIAHLPNLKNCHLGGGGRYATVPPEIFEELAEFKANQLEILAIHYRNAINLKNATSIGQLTNLKELICPNNDKLNDNCLQNLSKLHELELLDIKNCNNFSATGLLNLIQKCRKLKTLDVSHCKDLDEKFARKLLELLTSERKQRKQNNPLKLIAYCSGIQRSAVKSPAFEEASDILSISFAFDFDDAYMDDFSDIEDSDMDDRPLFNNF